MNDLRNLDHDPIRLYVALHNEGVRTGSFDALMELFDEHAELRFVGIPHGRFLSRDQITTAFTEHPPDDELVIVEVIGSGGTWSATYAWKGTPQQADGRVTLTLVRGRIVQLMIEKITF